MYITVSRLANAINSKQHIKTEDIIKIINVMLVDNVRIHYQVIDSLGKDTYYNENSIPAAIVKMMNSYTKPVKTWTRENRKFFQYHF